jgi:glutathione S-transferase
VSKVRTPEEPALRLWGIGTPRTLRPIWTLLELGLRPDDDFELNEILTRSPLMDSETYRALSPRQKIPTLEHGTLRIGESAAISLHLADAYRDRVSLVPEPGTAQRALHDELCWFSMTEMDAALYVIRRHAGLPEIYGASDVAVDAARDYFLRSSREIERRLADDRPHLLGEAFSIADLLVKTCLDWAVVACQVSLDGPLLRYSERIARRSAYTKAMSRNFPPHALAALTNEQG